MFPPSEIRNRDQTHADYIREIRTALNCERGLTSVKRATVFDALDRLHERLREAEEARDAVVGQVAQLRRQCQVRARQAGGAIGRPLLTFTLLQRLEDELSKKREELRDLLLMPASKKALPSAAAAADVRRKEAPTAKGDEEDAAAAAAGPSSSVGAAVCPSPLNLSAESGIDNAERSSSVDSALSKVRPRNCRVSQLFLQLSQTSRIPRTFENE